MSGLRARQKDGEAGKGAGTSSDWERKAAALERKVEMLYFQISAQSSRLTPATNTKPNIVPGAVVRGVQNDQKAAVVSVGSTSATAGKGQDRGMWVWQRMDHITLILFVLVSLLVLAYSLESVSSVFPSASVLRERLGETMGMLVPDGTVFNATRDSAKRLFHTWSSFIVKTFVNDWSPGQVSLSLVCPDSQECSAHYRQFPNTFSFILFIA